MRSLVLALPLTDVSRKITLLFFSFNRKESLEQVDRSFKEVLTNLSGIQYREFENRSYTLYLREWEGLSGSLLS